MIVKIREIRKMNEKGKEKGGHPQKLSRQDPGRRQFVVWREGWGVLWFGGRGGSFVGGGDCVITK